MERTYEHTLLLREKGTLKDSRRADSKIFYIEELNVGKNKKGKKPT